MSNKIQEFYDQIKLDDFEKEQMLENIWAKRDIHSEIIDMNMKRKMASAAAVVTAVILVGAGSVNAYNHIKRMRTPKEVINVLSNDKGLAEKFGMKQQDVLVQECAGYKITLFGYVTKESIKDEKIKDKLSDELIEGTTHLVVAIECPDGFSDDNIDVKESFCTIPFFEGYKPWQVNGISMGAGQSWDIIDNVYYSIMDYDTDLDIFADRKVYVGVFDFGNPGDGLGYDIAEDGSIVRRNQDQLNALFELKLDKSKADKEKADAILNEISGQSDEDTKDSEESDIKGSGDDFDERISPYPEEYPELIEKSEVIIKGGELPNEEDVWGDIDSDRKYDEKTLVYGCEGYYHHFHEEYLKENKIDYQWGYKEDENIMYLYILHYDGSKFTQDVYKYKGDPKECAFVKNYIKYLSE